MILSTTSTYIVVPGTVPLLANRAFRRMHYLQMLCGVSVIPQSGFRVSMGAAAEENPEKLTQCSRTPTFIFIQVCITYVLNFLK
jgi:hypothetical protein